jgi:signal transduction histidine kinase
MSNLTLKNPAAPKIQLDILLAIIVLSAVAICCGVLWLKFSLPGLGMLVEPAATGWRVQSLQEDTSSNARGVSSNRPAADWLGRTVQKACAQAQPTNCIALQPHWVIDSPIMLPSSSQQTAMVRDQQALYALGDDVILVRDDGVTANVNLSEGGIFKLNERLLLIVVVAVVVFTMGCTMLFFVERSPDVWMVLAMCSGYFLYMMARAWYTNRSWAQPEWQWWVALWTFLIGVLMCGCACMALLWRLRWQSRYQGALLGVIVTTAAIVLLHRIGVIDSAQWGYRLPILALTFLIAATSVLMTLRPGRAYTSERLAARTFALLVLMGFTPMLFSAVVWNIRPELPNIAYINNLSVATAFLPILILVGRSGYYHLHRFWWTLWLVLIFCSLAILSVGMLTLAAGESSANAIAGTGVASALVVFQLRAWLKNKLLGRAPAIESQLPALMSLAVMDLASANRAWHQLLQKAFAPFSLTVVALPGGASIEEVSIDDKGEALLVPDISGTMAARLVGAAGYSRNFYHADREVAQTLLALARQGQTSKVAYAQGAQQERKRIAADLHDDIGGKLLHMANAPGADGQYARNTLEDLRIITRGLSAQTRTVKDLLADLQYQLAQRAERRSLGFEWTVDLGPMGAETIGSRQGTVLASIASELLRNAMQHPRTKVVSFELSSVLVGGVTTMSLQVRNDGEATDPASWDAGLGTTSIRRRVHDLQGRCSWIAQGGGGVIFAAQWPVSAWLNGDTSSLEAP